MTWDDFTTQLDWLTDGYAIGALSRYDFLAKTKSLINKWEEGSGGREDRGDPW